MLAELALQGEIHQLPESLFFRRRHAGMSRQANPTPKDVAEWFKPGSGRDDIREHWGIFVESMRAIGRSPLGRIERARCYAAFLRAWWPKNLVPMVEERFGIEYSGPLPPGIGRGRSVRRMRRRPVQAAYSGGSRCSSNSGASDIPRMQRGRDRDSGPDRPLSRE